MSKHKIGSQPRTAASFSVAHTVVLSPPQHPSHLVASPHSRHPRLSPSRPVPRTARADMGFKASPLNSCASLIATTTCSHMAARIAHTPAIPTQHRTHTLTPARFSGCSRPSARACATGQPAHSHVDLEHLLAVSIQYSVFSSHVDLEHLLALLVPAQAHRLEL